VIKSFKADAVVDFWSPCACIAAKILGKPLITVISAFQHPLSPGFIWWKDPPPNIPTAVPWLNEILSQYGLPSIKSAGDLFIGDLTLVLGMPETDPLSVTTQVTYIGAVLWQNPETRLPKWFATLGKDRPVVWIYPGKLRYLGRMRTWGDSEVVLQASIEALAAENVQVIVSSGHQDIPRSFFPLPANFHLEPFVPGLAMAERSDLMIHHGGYGSSQTGLYAGTPEVIIPTMSERESNARRVVEQGAGEIVLPTSDASGKRKKVGSAELAAKVRKVLSTPSYKENAMRISARLKEYGGAPEAARLIENVVNSRNKP
jgi:UDP:flavonoid glycosyltransferase YjiC (YdhE family)